MSKVKPALTPEEWLTYAPLNRPLAHQVPVVAHDNTHAAAALALHGQPYGFTWDDYHELVDQAHQIEMDYGPPEYLLPEPKRQVEALRSLAARIAALLPPREDQG